MKDMMLDLETMGSNIGAIIVQIGACFFDRDSGAIGERLLINVSMEGQVRYGMRAEASTVEFWLKQPRHTFLEPPLVSLPDAIGQYSRFAKDAEKVWSHATFDFPMIQYACVLMGMKPVHHYRAARDIRTLVDLAGLVKEGGAPERTDAHDALADCIFQVGYCVQAFRKLSGK